jgi:hypothetical protein
VSPFPASAAPSGFLKRETSVRRSKHEGPHKRQAYQPQRPFRTVEGIDQGPGGEPFRRLSPWGVWVLLRFYEKFNGHNRANLSLPYREAKHVMSSLLFTRSLWELIGYGFIDPRRFGRLEANCSLYALSDRWRRLIDDPKKLDKIEATLRELKKVMREPGGVKKRMRVRVLRKSLWKG